MSVLVLLSATLLATVCASQQYLYDYDDYEYEYEYDGEGEGECMDWGALGDRFQLYEVSCQWCHNRIRVKNSRGLQLEFVSKFMHQLDLEIYDGQGQYQGLLDYNSFSKGYQVKMRDCRNRLVGLVEEGSLDASINDRNFKTQVNVYNADHQLVGFSTRTKDFGSRIEISDRGFNKVWLAERGMGEGFKTLTCSDPRWDVRRLGSSQSPNPDISSVHNALFVTAVVAVEGLKNVGDYDTCTSLFIALLVLLVFLLLVGVCLGCYLGRGCLKDGYHSLAD